MWLALLVLMREPGAIHGAQDPDFFHRARGKGVASSAALEVAPCKRSYRRLTFPLSRMRLPLLCQKVRTWWRVRPAVMDQMIPPWARMTLLTLLCQPAQLQPSVHVPSEIAFWGVDSGERHTVGGSSYESVRAGAFMGFRMIVGDHDRWGGYLANVTVPEFERVYMSRLPEEISGEEFLKRYSSIRYCTRVCFRHARQGSRPAASHLNTSVQGFRTSRGSRAKAMDFAVS
jgi:L-arabinokinase